MKEKIKKEEEKPCKEKVICYPEGLLNGFEMCKKCKRTI